MREVFAASSGSYSDYSVHALFESKELAEEFAKSKHDGYEDYFVEEFSLIESRDDWQIGYTARWMEYEWGEEKTRSTLDNIRVTARNVISQVPLKHRPGEMDTKMWGQQFYCSGPDRDRVIKSVKDRARAYLLEFRKEEPF